MAEEPVPFSKLLAGYGTVTIGEGMTVESVLTLLKLRAESGRPAWSVRLGGTPMTSEERLGVLEGLTTSIRKRLTRAWQGTLGQPQQGTLDRVSFSDLLEGLDTVNVDSEYLIESVFAIIKARRADGAPVWHVRSSEMELSSEELLGALEGYTATVRQEVSGSWSW